MENPFNITREEILELAARKVVEQFEGDFDPSEAARSMISERIKETVGDSLRKTVDSVLRDELSKIMEQTIQPVDIFGDKTGKPTTIRAVLADRAKVFWEVKVDKDGKESTWGGEPRHAHLMRQLLDDAFKQAVKDNATLVVSEFKKAITASAQKMVVDHINQLIK